MPRTSCPYDPYKKLENDKKWWNTFYRNVYLNNAANRFVYSDGEKAKAVLDEKVHFTDHNAFIYNHFFKGENACYGLVVIDKSGNFEYKSGEYTDAEVTNFMAKLLQLR